MENDHRCPPSPTLSADFIDDLDDDALEAYLANKGALSQWPTPPLKDHVIAIETLEVESDFTESDDEVDGESTPKRCLPCPANSAKDLDIATVLARECAAHRSGTPLWEDILAIERLLLQARLPMEVLAVSLDILSRLSNTVSEDSPIAALPLRSVAASAMCLASICTDDHPPPASWWDKHLDLAVDSGPHTDSVNRTVLEALDWRLHECTSPVAINVAMRRFERRDPLTTYSHVLERAVTAVVEDARPLALVLQTPSLGDAVWCHGQLTPDDSPQETKPPFLPLVASNVMSPGVVLDARPETFLTLL